MHRFVEEIRIDLHEELQRVVHHAVDCPKRTVSADTGHEIESPTDSNVILSLYKAQGRQWAGQLGDYRS